MSSTLTEKIDALLPQTQCTQCGYSGCLPYAEALATGQADINQCPPGGSQGIARLADLLGINPKPLNEKHGQFKPRQIAFIIEQDCIGCTKCLPPCPVDAIIGANKYVHTVIQNECTGCRLCLAPCPVDCIEMRPLSPPTDWTTEQATHAKKRYQAKQQRLQRQAQAKAERLQKQKEKLLKLKNFAK